MKRYDLCIMLLMDLGDYDEAHAAEIFRKELKSCRSERERMTKLYFILANRRKSIYGEAAL